MLQKWSKGKQKEKVNNMVLFDQGTYDKLLSEAPKYKLITPSILSDRLRVTPLLLSVSFWVGFLFVVGWLSFPYVFLCSLYVLFYMEGMKDLKFLNVANLVEFLKCF